MVQNKGGKLYPQIESIITIAQFVHENGDRSTTVHLAGEKMVCGAALTLAMLQDSDFLLMMEVAMATYAKHKAGL